MSNQIEQALHDAIEVLQRASTIIGSKEALTKCKSALAEIEKSEPVAVVNECIPRGGYKEIPNGDLIYFSTLYYDLSAASELLLPEGARLYTSPQTDKALAESLQADNHTEALKSINNSIDISDNDYALAELEQIHAITMCIAECPPIEESDTYTVKAVKQMAQRLNQREWEGWQAAKQETAREIAELKKDRNEWYKDAQAKQLRILGLQSQVNVLREAADKFRECVLNSRGLLSENGMQSEQINDVLTEFDYFIGHALSATAPQLIIKE